MVSTPKLVVPRKNWTRVIEPSASPALAATVMVAGAAYCAPFAGAVRATVGGAFRITATGAEVTVAPELSVTTALSE